METVILSGAAPFQSKVNIQNVFPEKANILPGKRDFSIITISAVSVAEKLRASAIITFSEEATKISTSVPMFVFTGRRLAMMNEITRPIEETGKTIYERMEERARSAVEEISEASLIAFINNLIDTEGLVVGIIEPMANLLK